MGLFHNAAKPTQGSWSHLTVLIGTCKHVVFEGCSTYLLSGIISSMWLCQRILWLCQNHTPTTKTTHHYTVKHRSSPSSEECGQYRSEEAEKCRWSLEEWRV